MAGARVLLLGALACLALAAGADLAAEGEGRAAGALETGADLAAAGEGRAPETEDPADDALETGHALSPGRAPERDTDRALETEADQSEVRPDQTQDYALLLVRAELGHVTPVLALARALHRRGRRAVVVAAAYCGTRAAVAAAPGVEYVEVSMGSAACPSGPGSMFEENQRLRSTALAAVAARGRRPWVVVYGMFSPVGVDVARRTGAPGVFVSPVARSMGLRLGDDRLHAPLPLTGFPLQGTFLHRLGTAAVRLSVAALIDSGVADAVAAAMGDDRADMPLLRSGWDTVEAGHLVLSTVPPPLEPARPAHPLVHTVGPLLDFAREPAPGPEHAELMAFVESSSRTLYVGFGSKHTPTRDLARTVLAAVTLLLRGDPDMRVVWARGRALLAAKALPEPADIADRLWLADFVPQRVILQHHSVVAFLSHCGQGGTTEAIMAGVPLLCAPITADQPFMAARLEEYGAALKLPRRPTGAETADLVRRAIADPAVAAAGARLRRIFQSYGGVERAADLVELHVDVGAQHLLMYDTDWWWFQRWSVDTVGAMLLACVGAAATCMDCWARCCGRCRSRSRVGGVVGVVGVGDSGAGAPAILASSGKRGKSSRTTTYDPDPRSARNSTIISVRSMHSRCTTFWSRSISTSFLRAASDASMSLAPPLLDGGDGGVGGGPGGGFRGGGTRHSGQQWEAGKK